MHYPDAGPSVSNPKDTAVKDTVPQSPSPDYRRADERAVVAGLRQREPLALAEAYHRTVPAAYACARRLLGSSDDAEVLLQTVYAELWASPPDGVGLEGWVRARCFELGADELRARGSAPASPSAMTLLPDLPAPSGSYLDAAERGLAELDERQREAILQAHDQGRPSVQQAGEDTTAAMTSALVALAGQAPAIDDGCEDLPDLADWVLGLVAPDRATQIEAAVASRPGCGALAQVLRAGRRRIEGLPITSDMGLRVLAVALTGEDGASLGGAPNETDHLLAHVAAAASAPAVVAEPLPSALDQPGDDELLAPAATTTAGATSATAATSAQDVGGSATSAGTDPSQAAPATAAAAGTPVPATTAALEAPTGATAAGAPAEAGSKPLPAPLRDELNGQGNAAVSQGETAASPATSGDGQDTARTAGGSVAAGDRNDSMAADAKPASRGLRVAGIVLGVLILIAGVALGLYIGFQVLM